MGSTSTEFIKFDDPSKPFILFVAKGISYSSTYKYFVQNYKLIGDCISSELAHLPQVSVSYFTNLTLHHSSGLIIRRCVSGNDTTYALKDWTAWYVPGHYGLI